MSHHRRTSTTGARPRQLLARTPTPDFAGRACRRTRRGARPVRPRAPARPPVPVIGAREQHTGGEPRVADQTDDSTTPPADEGLDPAALPQGTEAAGAEDDVRVAEAGEDDDAGEQAAGEQAAGEEP